MHRVLDEQQYKLRKKQYGLMLFLKTKINEASLFKHINFEKFCLANQSQRSATNMPEALWNDQNK